jgi:hypothetical protein
MSLSYVTVLYNINRETDGDGRLWDNYLEWFKGTLQHNAPMIVFIPPDLESFVKEHRPTEYQTHIIVETLEQVPYYKHKEAIATVLSSEAYKQRMADINRIECYLPMYSIIQYSKFDWMRKAAEIDPFNTDYYFWIDGGLSRFYENNFHKKPIDKTCLTLFDNYPTRFFIQATPRLFESISDDYIWDNNAKIYGGVFGGRKEVVITMSYEVQALFEHCLYSTKVVNNEQILLLCMYKNKPHLFSFLTELYYNHPYITIPKLLHGEKLHYKLFMK